jgi:hypothetical protein
MVPPAITAAGLQGASATFTVIDGFDHVCCWATIWPAILAELDARGQPPSLEPMPPRARIPSALR